MLPRVLEPEVMDTLLEAADYDAMDHAAVNRAFCDDLLVESPKLANTIDFGTGTALIPITLCQLAPDAKVLAVDLAVHMLDVARKNVGRASLANRIKLERRDAKGTLLPDHSFDTVISNSLVHHVPDPVALFRELARLVAPGGIVFVRDLRRPESADELAALSQKYAGGPGSDDETRARNQRQRSQFEASLHAALTEDEVMAAARAAGLSDAVVKSTSDRHWTLVHRARA